jgi:uncharacterized RDD family membrane protein YckC
MEAEHVNPLIHFDNEDVSSHDMEIAGVGARSYAFVIDWHIRLLLALAWIYCAALFIYDDGALASLFEQEANHASTAWGIFLPAALLYFTYHPVLEMFMHGNTPGKHMAGVQILTLSGEAPGLDKILIRNLLRLVDGFPGVYTVGLLFAIFTRNHVRLGDIAAGTVLVYSNNEEIHATKVDEQPDSAQAADNDAILHELLDRWSQLEKEQRMNLGHQLLDRMGDNFVPGDAAELKDYLKQIANKKNS